MRPLDIVIEVYHAVTITNQSHKHLIDEGMAVERVDFKLCDLNKWQGD